jgi:hypothetical protein
MWAHGVALWQTFGRCLTTEVVQKPLGLWPSRIPGTGRAMFVADIHKSPFFDLSEVITDACHASSKSYEFKGR